MSENIFSLNNKSFSDSTTSEKVFQDIVELYDYADEILNLVEKMGQNEMISNFILVQPLIEDLHKSTKLVVHEYVEHFRTGSKPNLTSKRRGIILNQLSNISETITDILGS